MTQRGPREGRKVDDARKALLELNRKFWGRQLLGGAFYAQLGLHGCDYRRSVVIGLVPEGARTFTGRVLRQDGTVLGFDIDLDRSESSRWEDLTQQFRDECHRLLKAKPWAPQIIASELLRSLQAESK